MARKLASIQKIETLNPIKKADFIEVATVEGMGWNVVVKKGEFQVGDACIFCEVDAVLPDKPWSAFMYDRKFRVKTIKLRKVLSQGLIFPMSILDTEQKGRILSTPEEPDYWGLDLTEILEVKKYECPANTGGMSGAEASGWFPRVLIPKTDEPRLQSSMRMLEALEGTPFYVTVKCDGSSGTYIRLHEDYSTYAAGDLIVSTRNRMIRPQVLDPDSLDNRPRKKNAFFEAAARYNLAEVIPEGFAVQGEVVSPGIQRNRLGLETTDLRVFNVWDIKEHCYLSYYGALPFCENAGLTFVPLVGVCDEHYMLNCPGKHTMKVEYTLEWFLKLSEGFYEGTQNRREGIVVRPLEEQALGKNRVRFSFKVINNQYLLKDED